MRPWFVLFVLCGTFGCTPSGGLFPGDPSGDDDTTAADDDDEIAHLRDWIDERLLWLDANLPGSCAAIP